jgi:transposase
MGAESEQKPNQSKYAKSLVVREPIRPLTNYTLSTVCPACGAPTLRHACKVRCPRCGFMWDCSEL